MTVQTKSTNSGYISPKQNSNLGDGLYPVHGIAIGEGDVTVGHLSEERKKWTQEALQGTGRYLVGKHIVVNHQNKDAYDVIGEVTKAAYKPGVGLIYQGHIDDEEIASKIQNGWLDVSLRVLHSDNFEENDEGTKVINEVLGYDNLSVVRKGAAPSNTINPGEHDELSVAELAEFTDELATDKEWREGDYVQWGSSGDRNAKGRVIDWTDDGTFSDRIDGDQSIDGTEEDPAALINVYQPTDEGWEEGDTTVAHRFSTLNEWNPDSIVSENQQNYIDYMFESPEAAQGRAEAMACDVDYHEHEIDGEKVYMPCESHAEFEKALVQSEKSEMEELQISEARMPSFEGTEEKSWGDIPADTLSYFTDALGFEAEQTDDLTQEQKAQIAEHTLLGDPQADNIRELRMFPVVNANTGNLNRGALEAVRGGRGQSADLPQDTYETAYEMAGRLLNEEFGSDVEVELSVSSIKESVEVVELQEDEELDEVYSDWEDAVNMTASQLRSWSGNPCSREASVDPEAVIERNLRLLETPKSEWDQSDIDDANRTISFISRMKGMRPDGDASDGSHGCPTDWAISLLNWAYNPFDSLPGQPDEDADLDDVEELSMGLSEGRIMAKHDYSEEEMEGMAEMMSSMSEMTMDECMELMEGMGPGEPYKMKPVAKLAASSLGADYEEMESYMEMAMSEEMMGGGYEEMSEADEGADYEEYSISEIL